MLEDVVDHLACPVCRGGLALRAGSVRCGRGHVFDVARQGYVSLLTGSAGAGTADTPAMVAARERFLAEGHYAPLAERVAGLAVELVKEAASWRAAAPEARGAGPGLMKEGASGQVAPEKKAHADEPDLVRKAAPGHVPPEQETHEDRPDPVAETASGQAAPVRQETLGDGPGLVVDAGAGTGHLLARVLDAVAGAGLAIDISKHAIKRAARAHRRMGAVVADVWRPLPVRDGSAALVLNAFAPRNGPEFARVLAPGGALLVVTPAPGHLGELVGGLGLLSVDEDKDRRLAATLSGHFTQVAEVRVETEMSLDHEAVEAVVGMGPNAWHTDPAALRERIARLPARTTVPALFRITIWKRERTYIWA